MSNLKALKSRISSVKSTRKITKAMQMVAAAKLRRVQEAAKASRPYAEALEHILENLSDSVRHLEEKNPLFSGRDKEDTVLLVIMTSDRGLCGGFNTSIIKYAHNTIKNLLSENKNIKIITVGRRAHDAFSKQYSQDILSSHNLADVKNIDFSFAQTISEKVISYFHQNIYDVCHIISSQFNSVISQTPCSHQIIPVDLQENIDQNNIVDYQIEPDVQTVLEDILPKNIAIQIFAALLENAAGEQGARMTAMDNATRNAGDMINRLTLEYNRTRQANITKELIEIISGAEAL